MISKKHKKVCTTLNYIEHFIILGSAITGFVSTSSFASLVCIPIGITSSPIGSKKKYKSKNKKKKNKHDKIAFLPK